MKNNNNMINIISRLKNHVDKLCNLSYGILGGDLGIIYYLFQISRIYDYDINPNKYIDKIFSSLHSSKIIHSYCNGLAGLGYTLHKLQDEGFLSGVYKNLQSFDNELIKWYHMSLSQGNIDPLHGALGVLYYFTIRFNYNPQICINALESWSCYLNDNIEKVPNGCTIGFRTFDKTPPYNLSLSHGLSGLIVITIEALNTIRIQKDKKIKQNLKILGEYLMSKINLDKNSISCTPNFGDSEKSSYQSRLAWCYGDLGVALALYKLGIHLNENKFIDASKSIIIHSAQRRSLQETRIMDRCICHGSSGVYLMFEFFNKNLFNGSLDETVKHWFDYTYRDVLSGSHPYTSSFSYYNNEVRRYELRSNILDGISGLGLGLITTNTHINNILFIP